jgi:hypothetical protein
MAQVISGNTVTEVTRDSAKVGCTEVSRQDVETLLKSMDAAKPSFEIYPDESWRGTPYDFSTHVYFTIRKSKGGFVATDHNADVTHAKGYGAKVASFALHRENAFVFLNYLAAALGKTIR